jgi:hypothetical protein
VAADVAVSWFFLTDIGLEYRTQLTRKFRSVVSEAAADLINKKTIIPKAAAKVATDAFIKKD